MSETDAGMGVAAGVIGAIITIALYWIHLSLFGQPLITESGVWITIVVSAFFTGFVPFALSS